jgi:hypothetical protein
MSLTRREFILDASKKIGLTVFSPTLLGLTEAFAQTIEQSSSEPHFLLFMRASGGAHPPMGLDPLVVETLKTRKIDPIGERDFYAAYRDDQIIKAKPNMLLGVAGQPLVEISDDIAIVNGVLMLPNTPLHESNLEFASSGSVRAAPFFPFQLAEELGGGPIGVLGNGGTPVDSLKSNNDYSVLRALEKRAQENQNTTSPILKVQALSGTLKAQYELFKEIYERSPYLSNDEARVMAAGFSSGLVKYGVIELNGGNLDTHSNHAQGHVFALSSLFDQFKRVIQQFKNLQFQNKKNEKSLFDYTTFVLVTDFARTAVSEGEDGTGHNPHNNSVLLAGKNIRGGQVIGASTVFSKAFGEPRLQALPFDFELQRALTIDDMADRQKKNLAYEKFCSVGYEPSKANCVSFITPGTVFKTLAQGFGMKNGTKYLENNGVLKNLLKA